MSKKVKKRKHPIRNFLIFIIVIFLLVASFILSYLFTKGYTMYENAISKLSIEDKIKEIQADIHYTKVSDISKTFQNAIVAIEDHRFYTHNGIDIITTTRAFIVNIREKNLSYGASSISQQLARIMYFTQEKSFIRKIAELFIAKDLEKMLEKDEILELYLNVIYYGDGYTGVYDACYGYFNKPPLSLTLYEASLLAGLPNAPSVYQLSNNSNLTYQRQNIVARSMFKYGYITENELNKILDINKNRTE